MLKFELSENAKYQIKFKLLQFKDGKWYKHYITLHLLVKHPALETLVLLEGKIV